MKIIKTEIPNLETEDNYVNADVFLLKSKKWLKNCKVKIIGVSAKIISNTEISIVPLSEIEIHLKRET